MYLLPTYLPDNLPPTSLPPLPTTSYLSTCTLHYQSRACFSHLVIASFIHDCYYYYYYQLLPSFQVLSLLAFVHLIT